MLNSVPAIIILVSIGGAALADEVIDQIEVGKRNYIEGDYAAAITEFEFALGAVRSKLSALFVATMPDPPIFWMAEEAGLDSGSAMLGGGLIIARAYREEKGDGRVRAELVVDSPMVQAFSAVLSNPIMVANEPRIERIRFGKKTGLLNWNPDSGSGEVTLSIGGRLLAKVEGEGLSDKAILIEIMETWDLDAVQTVAGL